MRARLSVAVISRLFHVNSTWTWGRLRDRGLSESFFRVSLSLTLHLFVAGSFPFSSKGSIIYVFGPMIHTILVTYNVISPLWVFLLSYRLAAGEHDVLAGGLSP